MFRFLVTQSLRNRIFVLAAAGALIVYGSLRSRAYLSTCFQISISQPLRS